MGSHFRTYGRASGKKEISDVNFTPILLFCNVQAVLIPHRKRGDFVKFFNVLKGTVNQLVIDHGGLVDWQSFLGFESRVKKS